MGEHRFNPRAIAAAQPKPAEEIGYLHKTTVEPNEKGRKRIDEERADYVARGLEPPTQFALAEDERDLVVTGCFRVVMRKTPSGLSLPGGGEAVIDIIDKVITRKPYSELKATIEEAFAQQGQRVASG